MGEVHFYSCDPDLNIHCRKTKCFLNGGACSLTTEKRFSIDGKRLTEDEGWGSRACHVTRKKGNKKHLKRFDIVS